MTDKTTPRGRCYHAIGHVFTKTWVEHLKKHPELLLDGNEDQADAVATALRLQHDEVINVLDQYEITEKTGKGAPA